MHCICKDLKGADLSHCWQTVSIILGDYISFVWCKVLEQGLPNRQNEMKPQKMPNKCTTKVFYIFCCCCCGKELHYFPDDYAQIGESGKKSVRTAALLICLRNNNVTDNPI